MDLIQAIILGIVQGLTEFIPISSTAHLVFASRWTGIYGGDPEMVTATMAVIQLGTLAAVLVYFAGDILSISMAFIRDHWAVVSGKRGMRFSGTDGVRPIWLSEEAWLGWLIILGSIPIGTIGLLFKDFIEGPGTKNLWVIAIMLIAIALLLTLAEIVGKQRKDLRHLGLGDAILQGFCQVLALMPGASRSGSTIMGGLFIGEKRETAARFSFLLSIPAITASGLLELRKALKILPPDSLVPLLVGTIVSAVVGYVAIWGLLAFLRKNTTAVFVVYRLILGTVLLVLLWQGVLSPVIQ
ncbi:MAG TPA: undecaprenyl-diphosphate phosphatase [Pyrinomonadaceae bacterium]|nr:undecaprenyl-diphosphate phosphatase [Chloracidobacterium sp.]MBP9935953.1 undecaprenyl-diphosphate phosphatase [Pyrinomonadaceae bacterium]MBK9439494.1 undecaprenyl-diphosphate phosphatase [Chloracidobacterium sp.]MBL0239217.1 undecaprenyl-diphosphate phosphatase [Chloracidobacterium sp.]HQX55114.1 undecaprenyl-diphosphate phosphatase [Pyrinomonadaceae bacterium]